ncbi:MAG: thioredoxin domain-containing protein [Conexivisphaerales archaeon]
MVNRLNMEGSPYLRMHANNPVDWYPWGDEAFNSAKALDRPIFLSIGYSSCHWCHRMNEDCFMDADVACLMNNAFINVKVDREERPDLDSYFMKASFLMTGTGGWPLTIIMTHDCKPFFAATYIPKNNTQGIMGMMELIPIIQNLWKARRKELLDYGNALVNAVQGTAPAEPAKDCFKRLMFELSSSYDSNYGGFGISPKFPNYSAIMLLLNRGRKDMVSKTLHEMMHGGIFDQLEYGFHRYSTDQYWWIPHFEKMLYDQSLSIICYTDAYRATGNEEFARCVDLLYKYMCNRLLSDKGGFYSSEDADSEGREGRYYTIMEPEKILPPDLMEYAKRNMLIPFGDGYIVKGGNETVAGQKCLELLKKSRAGRARPKIDSKILADWNSLAAASLAFAGSALDRDELVNTAKGVFEFMEKNMFVEGRLKHCFIEGKAKIDAMLEDYALMIWGSLELYEATFEIHYLEMAINLLALVNKDFKNENGPYYKNKGGLVPRIIDTEDLVLPSGNSIMLYNLLRLYLITGDNLIKAQFDDLERSINPYACKQPSAHAFYYLIKKINESNPKIIVLVGQLNKAIKWMRAFRQMYVPDSVAVFRDAENPCIDSISRLTSIYVAKNSECTAYVCGSSYCSSPINSEEELISYFNSASGKSP